jgi:hypothetical protein
MEWAIVCFLIEMLQLVCIWSKIDSLVCVHHEKLVCLHYLFYTILYHFNQLNSHASQAPVFCQKSVLVMHHQDLCGVDSTCDKAEIPKLSSEISRFSGFLHILPLTAFSHPNLPQNASKIAILRPFGPYQVSNFSTWSWSPVVCVEVSN